MEIPQRTRQQLCNTGFAGWLEQKEELIPQVILDKEWQMLQVLTGGLGSICLLVKDSNGQMIVAKFMPGGDMHRQALALHSFGGVRMPRLLGIDPSNDLLWLEYLEGKDRPGDVSQEEVLDLLGSWSFRAPEALPSIKDHIREWIERIPYSALPEDINQARKTALRLADEIPADPHLLHADMGNHNMFRLSEQRLITLDPSGAAGPMEWDITCASTHNQSMPDWQQADRMMGYLCGQLNKDLQLARSCAAIRMACSAGFGFSRGDQEFYQTSLECHYRWLEKI